MSYLVLPLLAVFPILLIVAGLHDLTTMRIPNWISLLLIVGFLAAAASSALSLGGFGIHLAIGIAALVVGAGMFAMNWIGGGDAKLMAAACLWLGLTGSAMFLLWTALAGGVFTMALVMARRRAPALAVLGPAWVGRLMQPQGDIPYGVAIATGALIAFPSSELVARYISGA